MLLVLDAGNTNMVLGIYQEEKLIKHWRLSTDRRLTADEYGMNICNLFVYGGLDYHDIKDIVISSVVPPIMPTLEEMARKYFKVEPLIIGPGVKTGMSLHYDNPREIGADRIVNAVAGYELYGGPLIKMCIRDRFYGYHGVLPEEKNLGQWFEVDLELLGPFTKVSVTDQVEDTLDYSQIYQEIRCLVEGESINLIETLAVKIADLALTYPLVEVVKVRVRKPQAPLGLSLIHISRNIWGRWGYIFQGGPASNSKV